VKQNYWYGKQIPSNTLKPKPENSSTSSYHKHLSYTSLPGYFAESFITTYLEVLMILAARNIYFKWNVWIYCLYSEMPRKSNLKNRNRLNESIII